MFTVTLSAASGQTVTVNYATANGTASAGSDYTATSGTLTFAPDETSKTVSVAVLADTAVEGNETFTLNLSAPSNATIAAGQGQATILDDDTLPTLSIGNDTAFESGGDTAVFTVTLSAASGQNVTVTYATGNGTASAGSDYTAASGTLTFAPGETSKTISVAILDDLVDESTENFTVTLSNASGATRLRRRAAWWRRRGQQTGRKKKKVSTASEVYSRA